MATPQYIIPPHATPQAALGFGQLAASGARVGAELQANRERIAAQRAMASMEMQFKMAQLSAQVQERERAARMEESRLAIENQRQQILLGLQEQRLEQQAGAIQETIRQHDMMNALREREVGLKEAEAAAGKNQFNPQIVQVPLPGGGTRNMALTGYGSAQLIPEKSGNITAQAYGPDYVVFTSEDGTRRIMRRPKFEPDKETEDRIQYLKTTYSRIWDDPSRASRKETRQAALSAKAEYDDLVARLARDKREWENAYSGQVVPQPTTPRTNRFTWNGTLTPK